MRTDTCFICGESVSMNGFTIKDKRTSFSHTLLPYKVGSLIGREFLVVISEIDKICLRCFDLFEQEDKLEHDLIILRENIVKLLLPNHNLDFGSFENEVNLALSKARHDYTEDSSDFSLRPETFDPSSSLKKTLYVEGNQFDISEESCGDSIKKEPLENDKTFFPSEYEALNVHSNLKLKEEKSLKKISMTETKVLNKDILKLNKPVTSNKSSNENTKEKTIKGGSDTISNYDDVTLSSRNHRAEVREHPKQENFPEKRNYPCPICEMPFSGSYILEKHIQVHKRSEGPVKCMVCEENCHDTLHLLYHHRNSHNLNKQVSCVTCDSKFNSDKELKNHIIECHSTLKSFSCSDCGLSFRRRIQLKNHKLYEHGNLKCRFCGKHILDPLRLRQHENRHARLDMKKFICEECGRIFKTPGGLRVHKVSHTGEYKFFCEFCGRGFMSQVIMEEHRGVHTKEERYICDICGRKFVLYSTLHLHKQWHKNPFPFPCKLCDKKFRYRSERSKHVKKNHTTGHSHKCPYCSAEFVQAPHLKRHLSSHTKEYFNCDICKKRFDQKRSLGRHLAKVHKDSSLLTKRKKCQYKVALRPDEYPQDIE